MTIRRYITPIFALTLLSALSERILAQEIRPDFSVGTPHYFLSDHLGSVRAIVDGNGDVEASYDYLPYGTLWLVDVRLGLRQRLPLRRQGKADHS